MKKLFFPILILFSIFACSIYVSKVSSSSSQTSASRLVETPKVETESYQKIEAKNPEKLTLTVAPNMQNFKTYLPILMFHYIENIPANTKDQPLYLLSFSPKKFEEYLLFFRQNNIETLTFWDLKDILEGKREMPKKAVMLTFDDGYKNHYTEAFRLLKKYNMKGVFFIIPHKSDTNIEYVNWAQIKEMAENGQEIGSHTVTHPNLSSLSLEQIKNELELSKQTIEEKIGKPVISLCYPSGKYDDRVLKIAKEKYLFARTTSSGKTFSFHNRYEIPTVRMTPTTGIASLKIWYSDKK